MATSSPGTRLFICLRIIPDGQKEDPRAARPPMHSSEPRLNKLPFYSAAGAAFTVALLIGLLAEDKFAPLPFLSTVGFLLASITAIMIPALGDYAASERESTARIRTEVDEQLARLQIATESLARAAAHIKAVEEAVHKSAREAETLPYRMQEKLAEFNDALAAQENTDREALERELEELRELHSAQLKTAAEKIHKATIEWATLEASTRRHLAAAQETARQLETARLTAAAPTPTVPTPPPVQTNGHQVVIDSRMPKPVEAALPTPPREEFSLPATATFSPAPETAATPAVSSPEPQVGSTVPAEPAKIKKPRAPRKPRPEETLLAMSDSPVTTVAGAAEPATLVEAVVEESSAAEPATEPESSTSSDGATRLLATAYIGIGNKLFIRGDGPGLSWDRGVPMQFVSIGKWGWASHDANGPVRIKLYKNDEVSALSGDLTLEPGRHTEVTALF